MMVPTLRAGFVAEVLDERARAAVYVITHEAGFEFGSHWRWVRGEMAYTDTGLVTLAARMGELGQAEAMREVRGLREAWLMGMDRVRLRWDLRVENL